MRPDDCLARRTFCRAPVVAVVLLAGLCSNLEPAHGDPASGAGGTTISQPIKAFDLRGEWLRVGESFACRVGSVKELSQEQLKSDILARACLHLGPFTIGDGAQVLIKALGPPHRTLAQPKGAKASIYFLEQADHYPYLVATVSKNRIIALQVTGPAAAKDYSFNHIDLGATTDTLVQYFGQPNHLEPSEEKDTELWAYRPWPFSFEVRNGHISSIRINETN